jgi:quinol monooxygenase YgiN
MSEITMIVRITAHPGSEHDLEAALRVAVAPTHLEIGCLRFALHRSTADPSQFLLVERWRSKAALDEHLAMPYLKKLLVQLSDLSVSSAADTYELLPEGDSEKAL